MAIGFDKTIIFVCSDENPCTYTSKKYVCVIHANISKSVTEQMKLMGTIRKALICQQNTLNGTVSSGLMTLMLLYKCMPSKQITLR